MSFNNSMTLLNKPQNLCFRKDCDKCLITGKGESTFENGVDYDHSMQSVQSMQSMQNIYNFGIEQSEFSTEQNEFSTETNSTSSYHSSSQKSQKKVRNSNSTRSSKNGQKAGNTITENRYVTNLKQSVLKPIKEKISPLIESKSNSSKKLEANYTSSSDNTTTKSKTFTTISNTNNSSSSSSLKQTFLSFGNGNGGRRETSQNQLIITESPTEAKHDIRGSITLHSSELVDLSLTGSKVPNLTYEHSEESEQSAETSANSSLTEYHRTLDYIMEDKLDSKEKSEFNEDNLNSKEKSEFSEISLNSKEKNEFNEDNLISNEKSEFNEVSLSSKEKSEFDEDSLNSKKSELNDISLNSKEKSEFNEDNINSIHSERNKEGNKISRSHSESSNATNTTNTTITTNTTHRSNRNVSKKSTRTGATRKVISKPQPVKQKFVQQSLDFVDITEEEEEEETLEIEEMYYEHIDNYQFHHYSVRSFEEAIRTILQSEYYLFLDEEIQWWKNYTNLSLSCKHLFVRLYIRKYSWVRQSKLQRFIPVCENLNECIEELLKSALIHEAEVEDIVLEDALKELTLTELKEVVKGTLAKKVSLKGTKSKIIASILRVVEKLPNYPKFGVSTKNHLEVSVIEACLKLGGRFVAVDKEVWEFFDLVYRVFTHYGERYGQNVIRESIRTKIENVNFMNYHISRSGNVFPNRQNLMSYDSAMDHIMRFTFTYYSSSASWIKHQNIVKSVEPIVKIWRSEIKLDYSSYPSSYFLRFTPAYAYTKLISTYYVPSLAALELYTEEAEILADLLDQTKFLQSERGRWWSRLCLLQDQHLSKDNVKFRNLAYSNCVNALRETIGNGIDSESATELYDRMIVIENQLNLVKRESRKLKDLRPPSIDIITLVNDETYRAETNAIGKTQLVIRATKEKHTPEEYALQHFKQEGWKSYHSEVEILTTLFALIFLDILFLPLPDVFETPFQTHPLDLGTEVFYKSRKFYIDTRLKQIESEDFVHYLQTHYTEQYPKRANIIGLSWEFELDDLIEISDCIGGAALSRIFKLFCHDYFSYNAGMPDLCIWKTSEKVCKFIKVNTKVDALSKRQLNWIGFLMRCGINAEICLLKDKDDEEQRQQRLIATL